jgi:hypothetical protein
MPPVWAAEFITRAGVPFTLVREQEWKDGHGGVCAFQVWREEGWVGFVHTEFDKRGAMPFSDSGAPLERMRDVSLAPALGIWRAFLTDGSDVRDGMRPIPSRRLGIMSTAYLAILVQLARHGWVLGSNARAHSAEAKALWRALTLSGLPLVKRQRRIRAYLLNEHLAAGRVA